MKCEARVNLRVGSKLIGVGCEYSQGHQADGSHAFAYHTGHSKKTVVVWKDGQTTVEEK